MSWVVPGADPANQFDQVVVSLNNQSDNVTITSIDQTIAIASGSKIIDLSVIGSISSITNPLTSNLYTSTYIIGDTLNSGNSLEIAPVLEVNGSTAINLITPQINLDSVSIALGQQTSGIIVMNNDVIFNRAIYDISLNTGITGQVLTTDGTYVHWANQVNVSGLENKLQVVSVASSQTTELVTFSSGASPVGSPSSWIPFSTEALPTDGLNNGWGHAREVNQSGLPYKVEWYPYNPYYGLSPPFSPTPFLKNQLRSVWAVIYTRNRINIQGTLFFNIFTYDTDNPPASYTNRFDYNILNQATPEGITGSSTLAAGFRYLICAVDEPKYIAQTTATVTVALGFVTGTRYTILTVGNTNWTSIGAAVAQVGCVFTKNSTVATGSSGSATVDVNTSILIGNGQYPAQTEKLSDPYDIFTDIPHIPFSAVLVTSNSPQPSDPSAVGVSAICIATTSSGITPSLDFTVEAIGYSTNTGENHRYNLIY